MMADEVKAQTTEMEPGTTAKVATPQAAPNPEGYDQKIEDEAKRLASSETEPADGPASLERRAMEHVVGEVGHGDRLDALEARLALLEAKLRHWI